MNDLQTSLAGETLLISNQFLLNLLGLLLRDRVAERWKFFDGIQACHFPYARVLPAASASPKRTPPLIAPEVMSEAIGA